ncbi:hypothetical protein, partial [Streptomyces anulatus]|uniref:hypothetical protein n=1 Tax=Streptomyces anulatus TaxID=1892 RepID=UPI003431A8BE
MSGFGTKWQEGAEREAWKRTPADQRAEPVLALDIAYGKAETVSIAVQGHEGSWDAVTAAEREVEAAVSRTVPSAPQPVQRRRQPITATAALTGGHAAGPATPAPRPRRPGP